MKLLESNEKLIRYAFKVEKAIHNFVGDNLDVMVFTQNDIPILATRDNRQTFIPAIQIKEDMLSLKPEDVAREIFKLRLETENIPHKLLDKEYVKENVYINICLLEDAKNGNYLIYEERENLCLTFSLFLNNKFIPLPLGLENLTYSKKELFEYAYENTRKELEVALIPIPEFNKNVNLPSIIAQGFVNNLKCVLTNIGSNALSFEFPHILRRISEDVGGDFYIYPYNNIAIMISKDYNPLLAEVLKSSLDDLFVHYAQYYSAKEERLIPLK